MVEMLNMPTSRPKTYQINEQTDMDMYDNDFYYKQNIHRTIAHVLHYSL